MILQTKKLATFALAAVLCWPATLLGQAGTASSGTPSSGTPSPNAPSPGESTAPAAPPSADEELVLLRIPAPNLNGLEPAVREQLQEGAARLSHLPKDGEGGKSASRQELAERFGELGHLYHAYELWPSAEAAYENARRLEREEVSWPFSLAVVAFKKGELAQAKALFEASLTLMPGNPPAQLYLAEIALQQGDTALAAQLANKVLEKVSISPSALFILGRAALAAQQPDEAIKALELALDQVPDANRIHYLLAMAKRAKGDLEGAKAEMSQAGQVGVKIPDPLDRLLAEHRKGERVAIIEGEMAMNANRFEEAIAAYERATRTQPTKADLWTRLGGARASGGDLPGAERDLRHALELDPFFTIALLQLGRLLAFEQKPADALPFFERLLDLDAGSVAGHRELGLALHALGRHKEALDKLKKVVKVLPSDEEARLAAAVSAVELGLFADGRDLLEEGLTLDASQGRLNRALARLLAAVPDLKLRNGERAVELAQRVATTTRLAADYELLALAYGEAGRCGDAADLLQSLAEAIDGDAPKRQSLLDRSATLRLAQTCRPPGKLSESP